MMTLKQQKAIVRNIERVMEDLAADVSMFTADLKAARDAVAQGDVVMGCEFLGSARQALQDVADTLEHMEDRLDDMVDDEELPPSSTVVITSA